MMNFPTAGLRLSLLVFMLVVTAWCNGAEHWLSLNNDRVTVGINEDLTLAVYHGDADDPAWTTLPPTAEIVVTANGKTETRKADLSEAAKRKVEPLDDGQLKGHRVRLTDLGGTDADLSLILAWDRSDRLVVEADQTGGDNQVAEIADLYTFTVAQGPESYLVVPRGSGYMIRADSNKAVGMSGFVGAAYSMPLFGLVQGDQTVYLIVDNWWDANVRVNHTPGEQSSIALDWKASHGKLDYARRVLLTFANGHDHVDMAQAYRKYVEDRQELVTLEERLKTTPPLKNFLAGIEYRLLSWDAEQIVVAVENIRRFQKAGLPVSFFHPKWPVAGDKYAASWQEYLKEEPVEGGWTAARKLIDQAHELGCPVKFFIMPHAYYQDSPEFDSAKLSGVGFPKFSDRYALWALNRVLDNLENHGINFEALYFDGHAAHSGHQEHQSAEGPVSRRETFEVQVASFRETRRRGIVPGAELARFWCISDCDYFFFTDWASDRLRDGEPIPLFQLAFHDCYAAHFSGGGYYDEGKYDWYADRQPRLYELMYGAMPSHNWLPGGSRPIELSDWETDAMARRLDWLRRWHKYFQAVCFTKMTDHRFLSEDRMMQHVKYANGIEADFDLREGRLRVRGIAGFSGDWEQPPVVEAIARDS